MSTTRGRTLAHMQQLLATATAVASCARTADVQTVTLTPLPTVPASTNTAVPTPTAASTITALPTATVAPPDPSGYLVVDMLPAPARCMGLASTTKTSAKFHRDGTGVVLDLVVTLPSGLLAPVLFTGTPSAVSSQLVSSSYRSNGTMASVRLRPTPSQQSAGVSLPVSCAAGAGTLYVNAAFAGVPAESTAVTVTLTDY